MLSDSQSPSSSQPMTADTSEIDFVQALAAISAFIGTAQRRAITWGLRGEEGSFFVGKVREYAERLTTMPKTYEQDGLGDQAIAYLHYFRGGCDWYITERDQENEQLQAFGLADLGHGGELGYISIVELVRCGVELDLYFTPATLATIKAARS